MTGKSHQEMLEKYAEAIVKVGLNLRAGQRLIITSAGTRGVPHPFAPLVREIAKAAYGVGGAKFVDAIFADEEKRLPARTTCPRSFGEYSKWRFKAS